MKDYERKTAEDILNKDLENIRRRKAKTRKSDSFSPLNSKYELDYNNFLEEEIIPSKLSQEFEDFVEDVGSSVGNIINASFGETKDRFINLSTLGKELSDSIKSTLKPTLTFLKTELDKLRTSLVDVSPNLDEIMEKLAHSEKVEFVDSKKPRTYRSYKKIKEDD